MMIEDYKRPSNLAMNIRAVFGRAYPRVIVGTRELSWVFFDTVLPLLGVAAYVYIYKALNADPAFIGFVILGGATTAFWLNMLWFMAAQFYWEKEIGNLELYMIAPISRMAILLGMAIGGMFFTSVRALSTLALGIIIFGVAFTLSSPLHVIAIFFLTMVALYGMGMLFASLYMLYGREAWHMSSLLQEPVYLLSGMYFPVKALGYWVAVGASLIPITLGLDAMRQLLWPKAASWGFLSPNVETIALAFLSIILLIAARYSLRYMENLGKREGRLTLKWQ
jgi:ABC-2 type transport system permease protein